MSIKVLAYDGTPFDQRAMEARGDRFIRQFLQLVFSGNYATGGDTLDLTNAGGTPAAPTTVPQATEGYVVDIDILPRSSAAASLLGAGGFYQIVAPNTHAPLQPADLSTMKMKIFKNSAGSVAEYPNGAYGTDVPLDVVILEVVYSRGQ
jgi:hypothetical protein